MKRAEPIDDFEAEPWSLQRISRAACAWLMLIGFNLGFIKVLIFLHQQWGMFGIAGGFTFLPPIFICPIWEWIATGNCMTFLLIYVAGFGGLMLWRRLDPYP